MGMIITENSTTELWLKLIQHAGETCQQTLDTELESYLVYMLMRHIQDTEMALTVLGPRYLEGMMTQGHSGIAQLQLVADQCLLFAGLYPKRSRRRLVSSSYYVELGRSAYLQLASRVRQAYAQLYENLSRHFVEMMDVLQAVRYSTDPSELDSLLLIDNWQENDSRYAMKELQRRYGLASMHVLKANKTN